jgi:PST family polysaccharide transporter
MGAAQLAIRLSRLAATVVLSRLLLPHDYGLAAIVLTAYEIVALFTRNGISAKVVQASADEAPAVAETAHKMTWIVCLALVAIQVVAAYPVAWIYGEPQLALPIAAMGLIYFATPLTSIQGAFQQREGRLGRIAAASAVQVVTDNILTAALALLGYGLWAIILPKILVAPIWVAFVRYGHAWRPGRVALPVPLHGWRAIAKFSRNVLGVELLTTIQGNIDNVLVGFFLGLHALGIYYFAFNAGLGITLGLVSAAGVAVYPHFCEVRHQPEALKRISESSDTVRLVGPSIEIPLSSNNTMSLESFR